MASKEKKSASSGSPRRFWRYFTILSMLAVMLLVWVSMLSFSRLDPPSGLSLSSDRYVHNWAGVVGSHIAYYLLYHFGCGMYAVMLAASVALVFSLTGRKINHLPWRCLGIVLLMLSMSTLAYLVTRSAELFNPSAGVLGRNIGHFLVEKFHAFGWVVVLFSLTCGLMFVADQWMLKLLGLLGKVLGHTKANLPDALSALKDKLPRITISPAGADASDDEPAARPRKQADAPRTKALPVGAADDAAKEQTPPKPADKEREASQAPAVIAKSQPTGIQQPIAPAPRVAAITEKPAPKPAVTFKEPTPAGKPSKSDKNDKFAIPSVSLLAEPTGGYLESQEEQAEQKRSILQQTLNDFNVEAQVVGHQTGPVITLFELSLAPGVKVSQVANLATDIARSLAVPGVRVVSPIPGKDTVGIEVPNLQKEIVRIRELMAMEPDAQRKMALPLYLGKDAGGGAIVADLSRMPHMLIAGTTGSGKSVCINTIIMSLLLTRTPEDVRFILVDPKMVEMAAFENIPHLLCPVVNDMKRAEDILEWAATKMDERYELLKEAAVKNIAGFNSLPKEEIFKRFNVQDEQEKARIPTHLPYYVIIIDELADLIMTSSKEVEGHIIRIAQKARAVGIHMILATQRPSVNVVTGLIKSNMPCRVSFRVASRQESRIVLDQNGAEVLLGQGDMLFLQPGSSNLVRSQGTFVDDGEIRSVMDVLRKGGEPKYDSEVMKLGTASIDGEGAGERDELFNQAVEIVLASQRGSVSLLQRRLQIGYSRSSRIIDQMAEAGLLGDYKGSQARECLMTLEDWQTLKGKIAADQSGESALNGAPTSS